MHGLGIKRMDSAECVDESIDESVFRWFSHIERMGNNERVSVGE